jgi:hypothetical protein
VLKVFTESGEELMAELRLAEEALNAATAPSSASSGAPSSSLRRLEGELADGVLPWLADQAADWEAAAAAGAPAQPPLTPDPRCGVLLVWVCAPAVPA